MMNRTFAICWATAAAFSVVAFTAHAQKATELYTPIGHSPGLSGESTVVGVVDSVDENEGSVRFSGLTASASALVTERTRIYLDRSALEQPNGYGEFADLKQGRRVEVLYEDRETTDQGHAEWIKIAVEEHDN